MAARAVLAASPPWWSEEVCRGQGIDTQTRPAKPLDAQEVTRKRTLHEIKGQQSSREVWQTDVTPNRIQENPSKG